jgi:hypothetical protein
VFLILLGRRGGWAFALIDRRVTLRADKLKAG